MITFNSVEEARAAEQMAVTDWKNQVNMLANHKWYRNHEAATLFFVRRLEPTWLCELERSGIDIDDETNLREMLGLNPTMLLLIHLFSYAYDSNRKELGIKRGKAPTIDSWPPLRKENTLQFIHSIPKKDIGRIIGKSQSAIERAVAVFRGRGGGKMSELIRECGLVQTIAIPTGIMLDIRISKQLQFSFMREDYDLGRKYAQKQSLSQLDTWESQFIHCNRAEKYKCEQDNVQQLLITQPSVDVVNVAVN